jgi:serine protease Do
MRSLLFLTLTGIAAFGQPPAANPLDAFSHSLEALAAKVRPSVVQIYSTGYAASESDSGSTSSLLSKQRSTGTGVIVSGDGQIVTNAHVVRGARKIQVKLPPSMPNLEGRRLIEGKLVGLDPEADLAVIQIDGKNLPHLTFGDSSAVHQGQLVLAFGNPLGLESSVSMGVISSTARQLKPDDLMVYLQTDAPINPGNSGGPLVDIEGNVIGINTFILTQSGGSEGLGFAIPSGIVSEVVHNLQRDGHVHRGQIGLTAETITPVLARGLKLPVQTGVIVSDVQTGGPAEKAHIQTGDVILAVDGQPLTSARMLDLYVSRRLMGTTVKLSMQRDQLKGVAEVPVHEKPDSPERFADMVDPSRNLISQFGILAITVDAKITALLPELKHLFGVLVAARTSDAPYEGEGLQPGDVIYEMNTMPVVSTDALKEFSLDFKPGDAVVFQVERNGKLRYVAVEME